MMTTSSLIHILILFLIYTVAFAVWNTKDYLRREYSLIKPYTMDHWDFLGNVIVTPNYVRLTSDEESKTGHIWNSLPLYMRDWEVHVQFKVHGRGTDLFGDGFAIWYTKHRMQIGKAFGSREEFSGLGIFFDTYSNHNGPHNHAHPYVSAMVSNGSAGYDHDKDGTLTELAGCETQFRNMEFGTHAAIRFSRNKLTVSLDVKNQNEWTVCFSVDGIALPTGYYLGASSATGELSDNHDIISMKVYELETDIDPTDMTDYSQLIPFAEHHAPQRERQEDEPTPSRVWPIIRGVFYFLLIAAALGAVGYFVYANYFSTSRKQRLY